MPGFTQLRRAGTPALVFITPWEPAWEPEAVALRLGQTPGLAWLDGGLANGHEGRYSFVGTAPCEILERPFGDPNAGSALAQMGPKAAERDAHYPLQPGDIPRWIGYLAYDLYWSSHAASRLDRSTNLPVLRFARYDALYAFDHERGLAWLVGDDASACARLRARVEHAAERPDLRFAAYALEVTDGGQHRAAIRSALAHIREGEVYEINLARRFRARFTGSALGLFVRMRAASPVPLGFFADAGSHAVLGRSMERFLRYRVGDRSLWTSPIKGTIARLGDDENEARDLKSDPKEHAEHAMVVDLMRNDLSRVAEVGSVEVSELMAVLPFAGLSHLVSTVSARASAGMSLETLIEQTFPPGSVTGTPKRRAVELIDQLEQVPRGVYTGALGFIDREGGCSFAVAIRTAVTHAGVVDYFAGGGIVAASDPDKETAETELKAQVFLRSLG